MQLFQIFVPETNWHGNLYTLEKEATEIAIDFCLTIKKDVRLLKFKATGETSPINGCVVLQMYDFEDIPYKAMKEIRGTFKTR